MLPRGFSWQVLLALRYYASLPIPARLSPGGFPSLAPAQLGRPLPVGRSRLLPASPHRSRRAASRPPPQHPGTGFSTRCPSRTPLGLRLGPDLPWADEPSPGTLRLSADRILTCLFATHTGILTPRRSTRPPGPASPPRGRSPTANASPDAPTQSFGGPFSPVTFSAPPHSTSELLRTLSMVAASKPTSWLSSRRHIVSHWTDTSGP